MEMDTEIYKGKMILDWNEYEKMIAKVSKQIMADHPDYKKIGIMGMARGGLPILGSVAYQLKTKKIAMLQISMSNSEGEYHPTNEARIIGEYYCDDVDAYVIVEDIIVTGKTIEVAARQLEKHDKKLLGVYSLFLVDDFNNEYLMEKGVKISPCVTNKRDSWIEFPWDKDLLSEEE